MIIIRSSEVFRHRNEVSMRSLAVVHFHVFPLVGVLSVIKDHESDNKNLNKARVCVFYKSEEERKTDWNDFKQFLGRLERFGHSYSVPSKYIIECPAFIYHFKLLSDGICGETYDKVMLYKCSLDDCPNEEVKASIVSIYGDKITKIND